MATITGGYLTRRDIQKFSDNRLSARAYPGFDVPDQFTTRGALNSFDGCPTGTTVAEVVRKGDQAIALAAAVRRKSTGNLIGGAILGIGGSLGVLTNAIPPQIGYPLAIFGILIEAVGLHARNKAGEIGKLAQFYQQDVQDVAAYIHVQRQAQKP